ncbi:hypothetical protein ABK040_012227 [Willaertia magna]
MQVSIRDGRFYQPFFKYPQICRSIVGSLDFDSKKLLFNFDLLSDLKISDLNNLNQIVTITTGYSELVIIYEDYKTNELTGIIIDSLVNKEFSLPPEFTKKEDIGFFYYGSDTDKSVYYLQLKNTKQVFVKGNNKGNVLGIFNEECLENWQEIKRLQNIKDIKTNAYTTLFFTYDNKIYACGRDTNGELLELTKLKEEQIVKVDLYLDGIIILTKNGEIFCMSQTEHHTFNSFIEDDSRKIKINEKFYFSQFDIDIKVVDLFSIDFRILLINKDDYQLKLIDSSVTKDTGLYYNEIKTLYCSYDEFYIETKKNELFIVNDKVEKYDCLQSIEFKGLKNPMVRNILSFKSYNLVFFEEEDLIKRNFYFPLHKCKGFKDVNIVNKD